MERLGLTHLRLPSLLILLDLPPGLACARITSRGGPRQPHETEEKLACLRQAYQRVVRIAAGKWNIPALVVDGARPLDYTLAEALRFAENILSHDREPSH